LSFRSFFNQPKGTKRAHEADATPQAQSTSAATTDAPHEAVDVEEEVSKPALQDAVKEKAKIEEPAVQKAEVHKGSDEKENHEADGDSPRSKCAFLRVC